MVVQWNRYSKAMEHLMVEQWNIYGGSLEQVWWNSTTFDGATVEHLMVEQDNIRWWKGGTMMLE